MASRLILKFHPDAEKELDEVLSWYADISTKLSKQFYSEFRRNISIAINYPDLFSIKYGCRKINLTRFPYLIFYEVKGAELIVIAIFHGYRNPTMLKEQIEQR